jgi:hypothetical protein
VSIWASPTGTLPPLVGTNGSVPLIAPTGWQAAFLSIRDIHDEDHSPSAVGAGTNECLK